MEERNMKKKKAPVNIMKDEELKTLITELVKKSKERGIQVSYLNRVIAEYWRNTSSTTSRVRYPLTQKQKLYISRVEALVEKYGASIINHFNKNMREWNKYLNSHIEEEEEVKRFKRQLIDALSTLYIVFDKEEKITLTLARKYVKYVDSLSSWAFGKDDINLLKEFFTEHLYFSKGDDPTYREGWVEYGNKLMNQKEFEKWSSKYEYRNSDICIVAITSIWFINKYFKNSSKTPVL